jgi:hypothetical protein
MVVSDGPHKAFVSVKTQSVGGTAEEKLAYEVIKMIHALDVNPDVTYAYLVLGGSGWSTGMLDFITKRVTEFIPRAERVQVFSSTDDFVTHVHRGCLFT